ncbi:MAG: PadR family transcriptional regulator [Dehalococcoidia bacterium]|nr:PadR family transcriptional regulator [Dehalococcoidia bacterium]
MSLKHGLLGFLSYAPRTGYELGKMFFDPIQPSLSLIYRKLSEMADEGLVTFERVNQEKLPYRNVFHVTQAGRNELKRWLREPVILVPDRNPLLIQLWFGSRVHKEDIIADIEAYADQLREQLEYYKTEASAAVERGLKESATALDRAYWSLVVDSIIQHYESALEWANAAKKRISSFESTDVDAGATKKKPTSQRSRYAKGRATGKKDLLTPNHQAPQTRVARKPKGAGKAHTDSSL